MPAWEPYKPGARKQAPLGPAPAKRAIPTRPPTASDRVDAAMRNLDVRDGAGAGTKATASPPRTSVSGGVSPRLSGVPTAPRRSSTKPTAQGGAGGGTTDAAMLSSMMSRLSKAEGSLRVANTEIARQDEVISGLRRQLAVYEEAGAPSSASGTDRERDLARRCRRLERTVHQMETFLADYGMIWVGDDEDEDSDEAVGGAAARALVGVSSEVPTRTGPHSAAAAATVGAGVAGGAVTPSDYDKILAHVAELNALAGEGVGVVTRRSDGSARIAMPEPVALRLYQNGIMLFDGPFRPLDAPITQAFLRDILDGYFPTELQERYPDGIPFKPHDHRNEMFAALSFPGAGHQVGGTAKPSSLVPTTANRVTTLSGINSSAQPPPQSAAALVARLPESVVRNGKLIDIRGDIAGQLAVGGGKGSGGKGSQFSVIDTEVVQGLKRNAAELAGTGASTARPQTPSDIATLQVKSIDGTETMVLKLRFSDTIGTARRYIDRERPHAPPYKLVAAYPRRDLPDDTILQAAGLTPRATVRMMPLKAAE